MITIILKALFWLAIGLIGLFLLFLIVYVVARIKMNAYLEEINRVFENSINQQKQKENGKEEKE